MDRLLLTDKGKAELRQYMDDENRESIGYQDYLR